MKLIVGLGNPGEKYKNTRHNAGFMFVDYLALENNGLFKLDNYYKAEIAKINMKNEEIILAKPQTFMNESGEAVKLLMNRYKLSTESDLMIAHDDLDIPFGKFHIQKGRGPKVHNGLESIENHLKTKDFTRIRIGVDARKPDQWVDGETYVLKDFSQEEKQKIKDEVFTTLLDQLNRLISI